MGGMIRIEDNISSLVRIFISKYVGIVLLILTYWGPVPGGESGVRRWRSDFSKTQILRPEKHNEFFWMMTCSKSNKDPTSCPSTKSLLWLLKRQSLGNRDRRDNIITFPISGQRNVGP
ncbi:hypothetical protein CEXT_157291 [Caerostris extrusa]|uniref:Uncharacterized protein n=1 Tax=Caerostris extrusa TaxID=172846 RepID=A0AAV4NH41_CAEEX|nr:hypothetical protein CEXT_157291 [Caerostris extrusa]